ncbi:nuclear transport factor 2 family protein [Gordonia hankookensis]|uniref:Nuclear transport factor 2 family protein n=1 Tax=Gordonia hankookensis TaxID=589403 RepID=A0ABR7W9Z6_9ACTN|nr:nuclear transport factor 2 family protein [Gordonia hankookensis]MBD1319630.1 nuclear transport factor 2 family protein [Gordonia hankookensis]
MNPNDLIRSRVLQYLSAIGAGTAADIAALYADDATVEDPVGSDIRAGRTAIEEFYGALSGADCDAELLTLRVSGNTAAFGFRVTTRTPDQVIVVEPIDIMTFDDDAQITSMRAIWGPDDLTIKNR